MTTHKHITDLQKQDITPFIRSVTDVIGKAPDGRDVVRYHEGWSDLRVAAEFGSETFGVTLGNIRGLRERTVGITKVLKPKKDPAALFAPQPLSEVYHLINELRSNVQHRLATIENDQTAIMEYLTRQDPDWRYRSGVAR